MEKTEWKVTDTKESTYIGVLEFKDDNGEWQNFEILETESRLVFGGFCTVGFLESGYIEKESYETTDEALSELLENLKTYYNEGGEYTNRIVYNERM